jgi:hypothetical protein
VRPELLEHRDLVILSAHDQELEPPVAVEPVEDLGDSVNVPPGELDGPVVGVSSSFSPFHAP